MVRFKSITYHKLRKDAEEHGDSCECPVCKKFCEWSIEDEKTALKFEDSIHHLCPHSFQPGSRECVLCGYYVDGE